MKTFGAVIMIMVILGGCHTAVIQQPTKNHVPSGMSVADVRRLITASVGLASRTQWDNSTTTAQKVMKEIFSMYNARSEWRIESIEPRAIRASIAQRGKYYVAVKVHFTETEWWLEIVDGKNIKYDGEHIHEKAILWVFDLERKIRRALGDYQVRVELGLR